MVLFFLDLRRVSCTKVSATHVQVMMTAAAQLVNVTISTEKCNILDGVFSRVVLQSQQSDDLAFSPRVPRVGKFLKTNPEINHCERPMPCACNGV
jgi:hypothetical protein